VSGRCRGEVRGAATRRVPARAAGQAGAAAAAAAAAESAAAAADEEAAYVDGGATQESPQERVRLRRLGRGTRLASDRAVMDNSFNDVYTLHVVPAAGA